MLSLNLTHLINDAKCYETIRQMRWSLGVCCPKCNSLSVSKRGKDETQPHRQRYQCKTCSAHFDDLTATPIMPFCKSSLLFYGCGYCVCT